MTTADQGGRWLIDGNNVMGSRPDGWWRDRAGAKARLARQVAAWSDSTSAPGAVWLVFDGRPAPAIVAAAGPGVELRFARAERLDTADDVIAAAADAGDTVVTADRGLVDRLPAGVHVVGPKTLLASLQDDDGPAGDE